MIAYLGPWLFEINSGQVLLGIAVLILAGIAWKFLGKSEA